MPSTNRQLPSSPKRNPQFAKVLDSKKQRLSELRHENQELRARVVALETEKARGEGEQGLCVGLAVIRCSLGVECSVGTECSLEARVKGREACVGHLRVSGSSAWVGGLTALLGRWRQGEAGTQVTGWVGAWALGQRRKVGTSGVEHPDWEVVLVYAKGRLLRALLQAGALHSDTESEKEQEQEPGPGGKGQRVQG